MFVFYVTTLESGVKDTVRAGPAVVELLRAKIQTHSLIDFPLVSLDTLGMLIVRSHIVIFTYNKENSRVPTPQ